VARLVNASTDEIALTENATVAWQMAFYALSFQAGDRILTAEAEYAANYVAYLQVAKRTGAIIEVVPSDESGEIDVGALERMIDPRVKLIAITWIPTNGGLVNPAAAVGRIARLLPPHRRAEARRRIQELEPAGPEPEAQLAREIALQLASPAVPPPPPPPEARAHLERALSDLDGTADAMVARWKLALEIAVTVPEIVEMHSILPLTRVLDPEVRAAGHAVLARLGHPAPVAPIFDVAASPSTGRRAVQRRGVRPFFGRVGSGASRKRVARRSSSGRTAASSRSSTSGCITAPPMAAVSIAACTRASGRTSPPMSRR